MNKCKFFNCVLIFFIIFIFQISCTDQPTQQHFQPRRLTQCVVFKNKIWLLGGVGQDDSGESIIYNDIWSSKDGKNWTLINPNFITPRESFSAVVFKGKIWIIGGYDPKAFIRFNDIWCSSDGKKWEKIKDNAEFGHRAVPVLIVFNKKLWLIGGEDSPSSIKKTDIWSSSDGINWSKENQMPIEDLFSKKGIINSNFIYIISDDFMSLKSNNGIDWSILSKETSKSRFGFELVTFQNKLYLLGGRTNFNTDYYDGYCNDVLASNDGINWKTVTENQSIVPNLLDEHLSFPARAYFSSIVFKNQIYVIAGSREYKFYNDVWFSKDGKNWKQIR